MTSGPTVTASRQVSWWAVHEFVTAVLSQVNGWPMAGTPAWCSLAHEDPRKWAAVFDAGQHHTLRVETAQAAMAEASQAISAAADWGRIGQRIRERNEFYASRPWLRRTR
jgi:hypothetical protein